MKHLLTYIFFVSLLYNSIAQSGGALMPSIPNDLPPDRIPSVPVPEPMTLNSDISLGKSDAEGLNQLRNSAAISQDPASLVEPIRWGNPLNPAEFDKIQNCQNYEKYGFTPGMTREQILLMHSDCCFNNNSKIIAIILVIIAMILIPVAIVKLIGIKNE